MVNRGSILSELLIGCIMVFVVFATLYPFINMIAMSLSQGVYVLKGEVTFWPKGFTWDSYRHVFKDNRVLIGYRNTFIYMTLGTVVSLIVTSTGAYSLSKSRLVFRKTFMMLIVFTLLFNGGMIPTFLVVKNLGLVNTIWSMVIPGAIATWNLIIMRSFFAAVPKELEEAGKMDGLNDMGIFARIYLPLSKAVFATVGLFYAVGIWNNFLGPLLYLRDEKLFPLQIVLRQMVLQDSALTQGVPDTDTNVVDISIRYATIVVSTLPILLIYPFIQKYFDKGAMVGSVKG